MTDVKLLDADAIARVVALEERCFAAADRWSTNSWLTELATAGHAVFAVEEPGGGLLAAAGFSVIADDAELLRVMTDPIARRQGLAAHLVRSGLAWASDQGARRMLLEVEESNGAAIALYQRLGFEVIASRADYYGSRRDALIMARELDAEAQHD